MYAQAAQAVFVNVAEGFSPAGDAAIEYSSPDGGDLGRVYSMQQPQPILIADLFPEVLGALLNLLAGLSDDEWAAPTVCPGWSVKDIAGHLLGDDVGMLSRRRDGYRRGNAAIAGWDDLVAFINRQNAEWVETTRRLSPRLLCDMLRLTGAQVSAFFQSLDPFV